MTSWLPALLAGEGVDLTRDTGCPELDALRGCLQSATYHREGDVAAHTELTVAAAESVLSQQPGLAALHGGYGAQVLRLAALLHDIGKPVTTEPVPHAPGEFTSYNHAERGAELAARLLHSWPETIALPAGVRWAVHTAVRNHMWHRSGVDIGAGSAWRSSHLLHPRLLRALWRADGEGRDCADHAALYEQAELSWLRLVELGAHDAAWPYLADLGVSPADLHPRVRRELLRACVEGRVASAGAAAAFLHARDRAGRGVRLTYTLGLPGAGKSTWARQLAAETDALLVTAPTAMRRRDRSVAHGRGRQKVRDALGAGRDVVVDATHLRRTDRDRLCQVAELYGAELHAALFDVSLPVALARQHSRPADAAVPAHRVGRMLSQMRWPSPDEYATSELRRVV